MQKRTKESILNELYHNHKKQIEKDLERQKEIEDCLGCKFIIINDTSMNNNMIGESDNGTE